MTTDNEYDLIASAILAENLRENYNHFFNQSGEPNYNEMTAELRIITSNISVFRKSIANKPPSKQGLTL
ncbi:MAG: hypothetical protein P9X24_08560 [Candidatus Hatepunaea meridiana]|nr:hypothetical protein [Candidatus Hatepunaea meridiana]